MLLTISDVLDAPAVAEAQRIAAKLDWHDGGATAGAVAKTVKRNAQADLYSAKGAALHASLKAAVMGHAVFAAFARPASMSRLLLSRTDTSGGYGLHVDNALMGIGEDRMRTDLSFTLFLSDPADYDGGDLQIDQTGQVQSVKPAAGSLVIYPSTQLHRVADVTRGTRLVCVGWVQSQIRDGAQREMLFDLENLRASLRGSLPAQSAELLTLDKTFSNLLRMWAEL